MKPWEETVWVETKQVLGFFPTDNNSNSNNNLGSSEKVTIFLQNYSMIMRNKHYHIVLILRTARKQKQGKGL